MPVRDPNKIDINEVLRVFRIWPDWKFVADQVRRPNGTAYTIDAICKAVRRHDLQSAE